MMKLFVIPIIGFLFSGCLRSHQSDVKIGFPRENIELIQKDCEELNQLGQFSELRKQLHRDANQVLILTGDVDILKHKTQIHRLADRIHLTVQTMIQMLEHKWNETKWNHELVWKVQLDGEHFDDTIKVTVERTFLNGREVPELSKSVQTQIVHDQLYIRLKKDSTSLEICELLNDTFGIYLKITYGSVIKISTHHRLTVKNERLLK